MIHTRTQRIAQAAYAAVKARARNRSDFVDGYASFAKSFPALIHGVGLCQAVAFAAAKPREDAAAKVLADLAKVLGESDGASLAERARTCDAADYWRLSRRALEAATMLKRYAETFEKDFSPPTTPQPPPPEEAGS